MRTISTFLRDDRGSQSIAFLLWVPVFVALLIIVMDTTTLYITQTEMENVARDTARRMIRGLPPAAAEALALSAMSLRDYPYTVRATFDMATGAEVTIAMQTANIVIAGYLSPLVISGATLGAHVVMRPDPTVDYSGSV
ncbi:MAG: pilus assembly protein [Gammaproteobacteria bacterium]|nr:pilus assembly protein [Gammaproteobacteria bacterium]